MSFIRRGIEARAGVNYFANTYNPLNTLYGQTSLFSTAGERVDEVTALGIATVLSSVSLLADTVASMPLVATSLRADGSRERVELPVVLADPSPGETNRFEFVHTIMSSLALHGNSYLHVVRDRGGVAVGALPLHPYQMNVMPGSDYNSRAYLHLGNPLPAESMLHIRAFTPPQSLVGISPLLQQRTMLGLALAVDKYVSQWYGEGATPSGVLSTDKPLTTEAMRNLRESWEASQRKHRRPAVLTDGLKWNPITASAVDMDFVAVRQEIQAECARIFRIPPYLLGLKGDGQTYSNNEAASLNFLIHTIQPWLVRLEIAFSTLLPDGVDVHFDSSSLLRLDALTAANVDRIRISTGTRTANEARVARGENPYVGGDEFIQVFQGASVDPAPLTDPVVVSNG